MLRTDSHRHVNVRVPGSGAVEYGPRYDPELLYVECAYCGRPVIWETGRATSVVDKAGIDPRGLDAGCLILSEGCSACTHDEVFFQTRVVRLKTMSMADTLAFEGQGIGVA